jgi:guanylate kinase
MSIQLLEILKNSSISSLISSSEISDIAEELKAEIEDYIESKLEDEISEKEDEIEDLKDEVKDLESEIADLERKLGERSVASNLQDQLVQEWVEENWETLKKIYLSGEKLQTANSSLEQTINNLLTLAEHKRIILVGKAASGKDHARKILQSRGFMYAVSYTTRPPRAEEIEGKDYFFKSKEEFQRMIDEGEFYEHVSFNDWYYGTSVDQFYEDDIFIMTPYGISKLRESDRKNSFIIFFDVEEDVRRERLSQRSDADTVERRLVADDKDFENFTDFDLRITNHNF